MSAWTWPDYRGVYVYAWDLAEEGVDAVAGRLTDAGANTLTLAASYHSGKFMRPHGPGRRVKFLEDGTVYFRPDPNGYGEIRPIPHSMLDDADMFAELGRRDDVETVAWTVCLHNSALGARHPDFVVRNAFGDPYPFNLCPSVPQVRDYVVNLCRDIAAHAGVVGVALESPGYMPHVHGEHHEFALLPGNAWVDALLSLSFSETCMAGAKAAGVDAERLRARTCDWLDGYFASDLAPSAQMAHEWWLADIAADPEWSAFFNWRCAIVTDLAAEIRDAMSADVWLGVIPTVKRPTAACWLEGSDLAGLAGVADVLEVPAYQPSAAEAICEMADVRRRAGANARLHAILRPAEPDLTSLDEVAAAAAAMAGQGVAGLAYYNYGHFRLPALERARAGFHAFAHGGAS